jgi:hypothetical protein
MSIVIWSAADPEQRRCLEHAQQPDLNSAGISVIVQEERAAVRALEVPFVCARRAVKLPRSWPKARSRGASA